MANDDQRFGWTPVEPAGESAQAPAVPPARDEQGWPPVETYPQPSPAPAPHAASIFAADPPGMGPSSDHEPFPEPAPWAPTAPVVAEPVAAAPVVAEPWAPIMAAEPSASPWAPTTPMMAEPVAASQAVAEPVVAEPVVAEPWAPIMATEPEPAPWAPTPPVAAEPVVPEPWPVYGTPEQQLAPSKPNVPSFAATTASVPTPIPAEEADVVAAWDAPRPDAPHLPVEQSPYQAAPYDPPAYDPPTYAAIPAEQAPQVDPLWALGAQAVEAAHLQAAGAPVHAPDASSLPPVAPVSFGEEQAFVPRFDPIGGVTSAPSPTLSFTEPAPRPPSPFSEVTVPQAEGPAYVPVMDIAQADRTHVVASEPVEAEALPGLVDEPAPFAQRRSFLAPVDPTLSGVEQPWAPVADVAAPMHAPAQPAFTEPAYAEPSFPEPAYAEQADTEPPVAEQPAWAAYGDVVSDRPSFAQFESQAAAASPYAPAASDPAPPAPAASPFPWEAVGPTEQLPAMAADPSPTLVMPAASQTDALPTYSAGGVDRLADTSRLGETLAPSGEVAVTATKRKRGIGRIVMWAAIALVVAGGLGYGAYRVFFWPEAEILAVPTITAAVPTPSGEPIAVTDASDFGAAMPDTVGTRVLMEFTATDPIGDATLPARAAEHVTLAYGSGSGTPVFTVEAFQHYTVEEATLAYDAYTEDMPDREDVEVAGQVVGERAWSTEGTGGKVVWRNNTAVFVLTGPADDVLEFFEDFGV